MVDVYRIQVKGHLADHWSGWFDGLAITNEPNGDAVLIGSIVDQAALHGVLARIRDLGLPLLGVTCCSASAGAVETLPAANNADI